MSYLRNSPTRPSTSSEFQTPSTSKKWDADEKQRFQTIEMIEMSKSSSSSLENIDRKIPIFEVPIHENSSTSTLSDVYVDLDSKTASPDVLIASSSKTENNDANEPQIPLRNKQISVHSSIKSLPIKKSGDYNKDPGTPWYRKLLLCFCFVSQADLSNCNNMETSSSPASKTVAKTSFLRNLRDGKKKKSKRAMKTTNSISTNNTPSMQINVDNTRYLATETKRNFSFLPSMCAINQSPSTILHLSTMASPLQDASSSSLPPSTYSTNICNMKSSFNNSGREDSDRSIDSLSTTSCPDLDRGLNHSASNMSIFNKAMNRARFPPIEEGIIRVCSLKKSRSVVMKTLQSKYMKVWKVHHMYVEEEGLVSKTISGFIKLNFLYSDVSDIIKYVANKWRYSYKNCFVIIMPSRSVIFQTNNSYIRDRWYHTLLWKKTIFKCQYRISTNRRFLQRDIIIRELRKITSMALCVPLEDSSVIRMPLNITTKILDTLNVKYKSGNMLMINHRNWVESIFFIIAPLFEKATLSLELVRVLTQLLEEYPRSELTMIIKPAITRSLKYTTDFTKSPDARKLLQVFLVAIYVNDEKELISYISSLHGCGNCPHPNILLNLASVCVGVINDSENATLRCYLIVLKIMSKYADWRKHLGLVLQPIPIKEDVLTLKVVRKTFLYILRQLLNDKDCKIHSCLTSIRKSKKGWVHIVAPNKRTCPDNGKLFDEMLITLLACCCRRKFFVESLLEILDDCIISAIEDYRGAQEALCLILEWGVSINFGQRIRIVNALTSTTFGNKRYLITCKLKEKQQLEGPHTVGLPIKSTDADIAVFISRYTFGNLTKLNLAFTSVTSACAVQLIKLSKLTHLNLWATQFGDTGLEIISEHLQQLEELNLCETLVSDKGISKLISLTCLKKLNLNSTKLSVEVYELLIKSLPRLLGIDIRYTEVWLDVLYDGVEEAREAAREVEDTGRIWFL